jgi:hypothetical protein
MDKAVTKAADSGQSLLKQPAAWLARLGVADASRMLMSVRLGPARPRGRGLFL